MNIKVICPICFKELENLSGNYIYYCGSPAVDLDDSSHCYGKSLQMGYLWWETLTYNGYHLSMDYVDKTTELYRFYNVGNYKRLYSVQKIINKKISITLLESMKKLAAFS